MPLPIPTPGGTPPAADPLPEDLADALRRRADGFGLPGLAIALAAPGRRALMLHGEDAPGSGRAVGPRTWFSIASTGKHFTAVAVLWLAQQGALELESPLSRYLPDLPSAWGARRIAALLSHTSGLPEYLAYTHGEAVPEQGADFVRAYGGLAPAFDEGAGWIYTNTNYILLGLLVARVAGQSYAALLHALFDRAGIAGVAVASPAWARQANAQGLGADARDAASAAREVIGDGDIALTPQGALDWLALLLGSSDRLLDASHRERMFATPRFASGHPAGYGCGWFVEPMGADGRLRLRHHAGHFDGWTALALVAPDAGAGVIAMCNHAPGHTRAIRALAQQALEGFAPGATPLALAPIDDDDPALTADARRLLLRAEGVAVDRSLLADELLRVAAHGSPVRNVPNLWDGTEPRAFELVSQHAEVGHRLRRYRLQHAGRTEHVLVGTTSERRVFWAWGL
jgi:CubicO group peptidase (beta-lactamase class C family)